MRVDPHAGQGGRTTALQAMFKTFMTSCHPFLPGDSSRDPTNDPLPRWVGHLQTTLKKVM